MGRPTTKTDLLTAAAANYEKLNTFVNRFFQNRIIGKPMEI